MGHIAGQLINSTTTTMRASSSFNSRESSPHSSENVTQKPFRFGEREDPKFVWRMQQPSQRRRYNLFPNKSQEKLSVTMPIADKGAQFGREVVAAFSKIGMSSEKSNKPRVAETQNEANLSDLEPPRNSGASGAKESVMDSPTIPGRFPVHERSISAPGHPHWRQNADAFTYNSAVSTPTASDAEKPSVVRSQFPRRTSSLKNNRRHSRYRGNKPLAPLIIPANNALGLGTETFPKRTLNRLSEQSVVSSNDTPPEVPPKSARMLPDFSPQCAHTAPLTFTETLTPYTPYTPISAVKTATAVKIPTQAHRATVIAPRTLSESKSSPALSTAASASTSNPTPPESREPSPSPVCHLGGPDESTMLLNITKRSKSQRHKRAGSESSVLKRGRPTERVEPTRPSSKEEREVAPLPGGVAAREALSNLCIFELGVLREEAANEAQGYEVLRPKELKAVKKELKHLDERCEYLRTTHRSLRSGRKNLHERICTYLRSPRVAKFSYDSLLRQEESLAELDNSIDEWVGKLEAAEERRGRVSKKLMEHLAACLVLDLEKAKKEGMPVRAEESKQQPKMENIQQTTEDAPEQAAKTTTPSTVPTPSTTPARSAPASASHSRSESLQSQKYSPINETTWLELSTPGLPPSKMSLPPFAPPPIPMLTQPYQPPHHHPSQQPSLQQLSLLSPQDYIRTSDDLSPSSTADILKHYQTMSARTSCISSLSTAPAPASAAGRPSLESIKIFSIEEHNSTPRASTAVGRPSGESIRIYGPLPSPLPASTFTQHTAGRPSAESIRIYAGEEVYHFAPESVAGGEEVYRLMSEVQDGIQGIVYLGVGSGGEWLRGSREILLPNRFGEEPLRLSVLSEGGLERARSFKR